MLLHKKLKGLISIASRDASLLDDSNMKVIEEMAKELAKTISKVLVDDECQWTKYQRIMWLEEKLHETFQSLITSIKQEKGKEEYDLGYREGYQAGLNELTKNIKQEERERIKKKVFAKMNYDENSDMDPSPEMVITESDMYDLFQSLTEEDVINSK